MPPHLPPPDPPWLHDLLALRQEQPEAAAYTLALELQAQHQLKMTGREAQAALDTWDARRGGIAMATTPTPHTPPSGTSPSKLVALWQSPAPEPEAAALSIQGPRPPPDQLALPPHQLESIHCPEEALELADRIAVALKASKAGPRHTWDYEAVSGLARLHQAALRRRRALNLKAKACNAPQQPPTGPTSPRGTN